MLIFDNYVFLLSWHIFNQCFLRAYCYRALFSYIEFTIHTSVSIREVGLGLYNYTTSMNERLVWNHLSISLPTLWLILTMILKPCIFISIITLENLVSKRINQVPWMFICFSYKYIDYIVLFCLLYFTYE